MAHNFKELQTKMDPERRARVEQCVTEALKAMPLAGLREASSLWFKSPFPGAADAAV